MEGNTGPTLWAQEWLEWLHKEWSGLWHELQDRDGRERVWTRIKAHFREWIAYYVFGVILLVIGYGLWMDVEDGRRERVARETGKMRKGMMTGGAPTAYYGIYEPEFTPEVREKLDNPDISDNEKTRAIQDIVSKVNKEKNIDPSKSQGAISANQLLEAHIKSKKITVLKPPKENGMKNVANIRAAIGVKGGNLSGMIETTQLPPKGNQGGGLGGGGGNNGVGSNMGGDGGNRGIATINEVNSQVQQTSQLTSAQQPKFPTQEKLNNAKPQTAAIRNQGTSMGTQTDPEHNKQPNHANAAAQTSKLPKPVNNPQPKPSSNAPPAKQPGIPIEASASSSVNVSVSIESGEQSSAPAPTAPAANAPKPTNTNTAAQTAGEKPPAGQQKPQQTQQAPTGPQKGSRKDQGADAIQAAVAAVEQKKAQKQATKTARRQQGKQYATQSREASKQFKRSTPGSAEASRLIEQVKQGAGQQFGRIGNFIYSILIAAGLATAAGVTVLNEAAYKPVQKVATMAMHI